MTPIVDPRDYYAVAEVRERIEEYCGASDEHQPTCAFLSELAPGGHVTWATAPRFSTHELRQLCDRGWDISRSLEDRRSFVVYFEIEINDPDDPASALRDPADAFAALEPTYQAISEELARLELPLVDVMTGRGYHFAGHVPLCSPAVTRVSALAPRGTSRRERAFTGLGMVLEYIAHNVYRRAATHGTPVVLNGAEVGRTPRGRRAVSIDLSAYGDPLRERQMRVAFGTYQSHRIRPDIFGGEAARDVPALVALPRRRRSLSWMLAHARSLSDGAAMAPAERARLPNVAAGLENLVVEYDASALAGIHRAFYRVQPHGPEEWPDTYDRITEGDVLPCVAQALRCPNDALLKPTVLQQLTRYLMAHDWAPAHIAGLVWSKYGRDFGWGDRWRRLDARQRAEFDVRVFASAIQSGIDEAIDFNCVSSQEKGICPRSGCRHDLRLDRARLLERVAV